MKKKKIRFYDVLADYLIVAERMTFDIASIVAEAIDEYYDGTKQITIAFSQREKEESEATSEC